MRKKCFRFFSITLILLVFTATPKTLLAANVTITVPTDFSTIQAAIDNAASLASINTGTTYSVLVKPGTYSGFTMKNGISVSGNETARTIVSAGGTRVAVSASGVTGTVVLSNFTVINATTGVQVTGGSTLKIKNNVFQVGTSGTAVQITGSTAASVINNTFYLNGTAISRDSDQVQIINNIFSNNSTNISQTITSQSGIDSNLFNPTPTGTTPIVGTNSIPNATVTNPDPLFVDPTAGTPDFHVKEGSPCIGAGTNINGTNSFNGLTSDIGVYGGPGSDTIPFPVTVASANMTTSTSITVNWNANKSYLVTNATTTQGSYNVYYNFMVSGPTYTNVQNVVSPTVSAVLSGLTTSAPVPPVPTITGTSPLDGKLQVFWTASSGATGYKIHYGISSVTENTIDVQSANTSYTITNLTNGQKYLIAVSAYAQPAYHIAVTAVDNTGMTPRTPGVSHESDYSTEQKVSIGSISESSNSATVEDFPERIASFPDLPNSGCFIATAAYGYYSAPQVQALRIFRDRYLMTNAPGRLFVHWYYRYGPIGAGYMNTHPWLKPLVRTALLPAVGGALVMTETSFRVKLIAFLFCGFLIYALVRRKKISRCGGAR